MPACHLVAFPEPVAAALFRPGLNVPPAPRGPRSWSALTRPPRRRGHPRGVQPRPPQDPTPPRRQASPAVLDPSPLLPFRGTGYYAPPGGGEGILDSSTLRSSSPRATVAAPSAAVGDRKPKGFVPQRPAALEKGVSYGALRASPKSLRGLLSSQRSAIQPQRRGAGSPGSPALGRTQARAGAALKAAGPGAAPQGYSAPAAGLGAGGRCPASASLGAAWDGAGVVPARNRGRQRAGQPRSRLAQHLGAEGISL